MPIELLNERLLTIEWELRELPDVSQTERGSLAAAQHVGRGRPAGGRADRRADGEGASCTTVSWPLGAERLVDAGSLRAHLGGGTLTEGRVSRVSSW